MASDPRCRERGRLGVQFGADLARVGLRSGRLREVVEWANLTGVPASGDGAGVPVARRWGMRTVTTGLEPVADAAAAAEKR